MLRSHVRTWCLSAAAGLAVSSVALAQAVPPPSQDVRVNIASGVLDLGPVAHPGAETVLAWSQEVRIPHSPWMRVRFAEETRLAGVNRARGGSYLVITSLHDGEQHFLDAQSLPEWDNFSAIMNGEAVRVDLYVAAGGENRVVIDTVVAGLDLLPPRTICGTTDDRVPYNEPRTGRINVGCTGWLISENGNANELLTAGHCVGVNQAGVVMLFNVPPSTSTGALVAPPPAFQFPVQAASIQRANVAIGNDWARFNTNNNSNTGLPARVAQGRGAYILASAAPAGGTATTTVRGHGVVNDQAGIPAVPNQWEQINKTHAGPYAGKVGTRINYSTDTSGGNSGSPVTQILGTFPLFFEQAIGIHTNAGCPGGTNSGTAIELAGLQSALSGPLGTAYPYDGTVSKVLSTTLASNNGGSDGGSIFFDVATGPRAIEVTHLLLNVFANGSTSNATATEADDFFNFEVFIRPGTAAGAQTTAAAWTKVADGAGMPKPQDEFTLGALKNTFTLNGSQTYGVAIVFDSGAGHRYTNGTGTNEVYTNPDLTITGISASNTPFGSIAAGRVFNGGIGYQLNQSAGQCTETLFAQNNGGNNGGMVYFNATVGSLPITLTGLSTNVAGVGGLACNLTLYRKLGTHVGFESNPGAWTEVATAAGTSSAVNTPSPFALSDFVTLNANTTYGFALRLSTSGTSFEGHSYTNGTGLNQQHTSSHVTINTGAASNAPFGTTLTPRVWNGSLCYGVNLASCASRLVAHDPPNASISGLNSVPGGQEEADSFSVPQTWILNGATLWAGYSNSPTPPTSQTIVLRIFSNSGGLPGSLVATRTVTGVPVLDTGLTMAGFNSPIYQYTVSFASITLSPGQYWLSALGDTVDFTWGWARTNTLASAHAFRTGAGAWTLSSGDFAFVICGQPRCYPNCDGSAVNPFLNVADFGCFLTQYAAAAPYANCDNSTTPPVLNVADFGCFLTKYAAGCSAP
ncbi:MAG: hypothetical protein WD749_02945 [Phycisphaerales bacterium]